MQRIMIIGCGGAGKSELARALHKITGLPLIHLDQYYWQPGWVEPAKDDWIEAMKQLANSDEWIIDGNYGGTMDVRIARADTIIFLDLSTATCLWQVFKRTLRYWRRTRPDMTDGCVERFDWAFTHYIWTYRKIRRPSIMQKLEKVQHYTKIYKPKSLREIDCLVLSVENEFKLK